MNIKQLATDQNVTVAKLKEVSKKLFNAELNVFTPEQIEAVKQHLTAPITPPESLPALPESKKINLVVTDSGVSALNIKNTTAIALPENYETLYNSLPVAYQQQIDLLPDHARFGAIKSALAGILEADIENNTKQVFKSARTNQLINADIQQQAADLQQLGESAKQYTAFDVASFMSQVKEERQRIDDLINKFIGA
jgi:hypothetical protein